MSPRATLLTFVTGALLLAPVSSLRAAEPPADTRPRSPELFMAIGQGNLAGVKALLANGASPNARNTIDMSALMIAAATGQVEIMDALIKAGADVNGQSPYGTPILFAAESGGAPPVKALLALKADINAVRPDRITALMLAARDGRPDLVKLVLAQKPALERVDNHGTTALGFATRAGNIEATKLLLAAGARVEAADIDGLTPLMQAAMNGHSEVVKLLLGKKASVTSKDKKGRTALLLASTYTNSASTIQALLGAGADRNAKDLKGRTSLASAAAKGHDAVCAVLTAKGSPVPSAAALRTPRQAVQKSLPRLEHAMTVFSKRTGCVSCHHEGIGRWATGFAQEHGFAIDTALAQAQDKKIAGFLNPAGPLVKAAVADPSQIKNVPIVDVGDLVPLWGSLFNGVAEHGTKTELTGLADNAVVLNRVQTPDGCWSFGFHRVPMQSSQFTMTAMTVRLLKLYAPKSAQAEVAANLDRAHQWLNSAPAKDNEDRAFRLLGLKWVGASDDEIRKAADELLAAQQKDGGWAQLPGMASDAYATGSTLFALNQGGGLAVQSPAYQAGVKYLLRNQDDEGAWFVNKRAVPANNYFDAEYPYGQSQYISFIAGCWSTMALILAAK